MGGVVFLICFFAYAFIMPYVEFKLCIEPKLKKELERAKKEKEEYLKGRFEHDKRVSRLEAFEHQVNESYSELNKRVSEKIIHLEMKMKAIESELNQLKSKNNGNE